MAMNDEETAALIVGGHTLGKTHGAGPAMASDPSPRVLPIEQQGLGWKCPFGSGKAGDSITSGLEVVWTPTPTQVEQRYLEILYGNEWELTKSPAGAWQFEAKDAEATIPGSVRRGAAQAHDAGHRRLHAGLLPSTPRSPGAGSTTPRSSTRRSARPGTSCCTATWVRSAAILGPVDRRAAAVAGPGARRRGRADRRVGHQGPEGEGAGLRAVGVSSWSRPPGRRRRASAAPTSAAAPTARVCASSRQKNWEVNEPSELAKVLPVLEKIQQDFNGAGGKKVSLADLIVLAGSAAVEKAAKDGGYEINVHFAPGRTDASQENTDVESFGVLEPRADGFRNYVRPGEKAPLEELLLEKAYVLDRDRARTDRADRWAACPRRQPRRQQARRVHRQARRADERLLRQSARHGHGVEDIGDGGERLRRCRPRLGSDEVDGHRQRPGLRFTLACCGHWPRYYAQDDGKEKFVEDFVAAWVKVMNNDRFDLA